MTHPRVLFIGEDGDYERWSQGLGYNLDDVLAHYLETLVGTGCQCKELWLRVSSEDQGPITIAFYHDEGCLARRVRPLVP